MRAPPSLAARAPSPVTAFRSSLAWCLCLCLCLLVCVAGNARAAEPQGRFYGVAGHYKDYSLQVEVCLGPESGLFIDRHQQQATLTPSATGWQVQREGRPAGRWVIAPRAKAIAGSAYDGHWIDENGHDKGPVQIARLYSPVPLTPGCSPARPADVATRLRAVSVSAGSDHTCAATAQGHVACWGGDAWPADPANPSIAALPLDDVTAVSGDCGLRRDGSVACWDKPDRRPRTIVGTGKAVALSGHCVLTDGGDVRCWGDGDLGQLGYGGIQPSAAAVTVASLAHVVSISGSDAHACAALSDGRVACWGNLSEPQGKFGETDDSATRRRPVFIDGIRNAVAVSAGTFHECALLRDGHVKCWTQPVDGAEPDATPSASDRITDAIAVSAGTHFTCALLRSGEVRCWGENGDGQAGVANDATRGAPFRVEGVDHAVAITTGYQHACALLAGGDLECWGRNNSGALGHLDAWAAASGGARANVVPGFGPAH